MKLDQQVCSLESAKRLKELGVAQESLFYWAYDFNEWVIYSHLVLEQPGFGAKQYKSRISAFTVAELGELLPMVIKMFGISKMVLVQGKTIGNQYRCDYRNEKIADHLSQIEDTEAECRAQMLIYLLENSLINKYSLGKEG